MIRCPNCGYQNDQNNPVCISCCKPLFAANSGVSFHSQQKEWMDYEAEQATQEALRKVKKRTIGIIILAVVVIAFFIWYQNRLNVDPDLVGTWGNGYTATYQFQKDGKATITNYGVDIPYEAKNGEIRLNPDTDFETVLTYKIGKYPDSNGKMQDALFISTRYGVDMIYFRMS